MPFKTQLIIVLVAWALWLRMPRDSECQNETNINRLIERVLAFLMMILATVIFFVWC